MTGRIHSLQSLGTVDGPGIRYVVFMQGCPLCCACCHNPDSWDTENGTVYTAKEIANKALRFREYFGKDGGVTISGGEPLLQSEFCLELFKMLHSEGINTCLDTSGYILNESVKALLKETDRVLLDIKYANDELYKKYVGIGIDGPIRFLEYLNENGIDTVIRQVIIPSINDNEKSITELKTLALKFECVDKIELLPFHKICQVKYDQMGIEFPFKDKDTPTKEKMAELEKYL